MYTFMQVYPSVFSRGSNGQMLSFQFAKETAGNKQTISSNNSPAVNYRTVITEYLEKIWDPSQGGVFRGVGQGAMAGPQSRKLIRSIWN